MPRYNRGIVSGKITYEEYMRLTNGTGTIPKHFFSTQDVEKAVAEYMDERIKYSSSRAIPGFRMERLPRVKQSMLESLIDALLDVKLPKINLATISKTVSAGELFFPGVKVRQVNSRAMNEVKSNMALFSTMWQHKVDKVTKEGWAKAADRLNKAYGIPSKVKMPALHSWLTVPVGPFNGFTLFIASNTMAQRHGLSVPRFVPPVNAPIPPPPTNVTIENNFTFWTVEWKDPDMSKFPPTANVAISLWLTKLGKVFIQPHIEAVLSVPSGEFFDITTLRKHDVNVDVPLWGSVFVRVWLKTVAAVDSLTGPLWSISSNVAELRT